MSIPHSYYESLCALAATGQAAHDELAALREHTQTCEECRCALVDFRYFAAQILPECATRQVRFKAPPRDVTARFIARARSEGIPLSDEQGTPRRLKWFPRARLVLEVVCAILLLSALIANYLLLEKTHQIRPSTTADYQRPPLSNDRNAAAEHDELVRRLQVLQARLSQSDAELAARQAALESARSETQRLEIRLANLLKLQKDLTARQTEIAELSSQRDQLRGDVEILRSAKATQDLLFQTNRSEMESLRIQVASLSQQLNEREQLSAAAEQAKDLIVARNLHIVDVHDNANGNRPRPFGRIFYTEGQKLIFYAYDLGDAKSNAKVTFYAWGERSGTPGQAKHLGILHADDKREGRWVVTFDDPQVLAQINTVFVTAESPKKEPNKPSNNRILVAFLGGAPNHP